MMGGAMGGLMGLGGDNLYSVAADQLGLKLTELLTELKDDKSIADLAKEKGVDTQGIIVDAHVAQVKERLDAAVADGAITQKQADYQLERITERAAEQIEGTGIAGGAWRGRGCGRMGFPGIGGF